MAVIALCYIEGIATIVSGVAELNLAGRIVASNTLFGSSGEFGAVQVNVNSGSFTMNGDIESAAAAKLAASPYNITFGTGDVVRLLPASG